MTLILNGVEVGAYTDADAVAAVEAEATLAFGQPTVLSTASGDLTINAFASLNITLTDDDGDALDIANSAVSYYKIGTVNTSSTVIHVWDAEDATMASSSGSRYILARFEDHVLNYTGTNTITSLGITLDLQSQTIAGNEATLTVNKATNIAVVAPIEGGNVTLTATSAIRILNTGGTPTNQYGIYIEALTAGGTDIGISMQNDLDLRSAGTILNVGNAGNDWTGAVFSHSGGLADGQQFNLKAVTGTKTTNSGTGTETVSNAIPAGAIVFGVTTRVKTVLAGSGLTTWSVGLSGDTDRWGTGLAVTDEGTTDSTDFASDVQPSVYPAATDLVFTAAAGQFDSGLIRWTVHYYDFTTAAS